MKVKYEDHILTDQVGGGGGGRGGGWADTD